MEGLRRPSELAKRAGELGRPVVRPQRAGEPRSAHDAELQGLGQAREVVPVLGDEANVDPVPRQLVEDAMAGLGIDPPEAGPADIGDPATELTTQRTKHDEDRVDVGSLGS